MAETHHVTLRLDVANEPEVMEATAFMNTDAEVIKAVTEFLTKFVAPNHGLQRISIVIVSGPDNG